MLSFHWHQKSLGVQGGQPGSYLAFNGSLKLGPRDGGTHTRTYIHTNCRVSETKPRPCSHLLTLFISLFFGHFPPLSSQKAAALDVLQTTIPGASGLLYDFNSFLKTDESAVTILSLHGMHLPLAVYFYPIPVRNVYVCINPLHFVTFDLFRKNTFFTCAGTLLLRLRMLI